MAYNVPTADFQTTTLQAPLAAAATSMTIGTGLDIPATNGILQIDYDSTVAVGTDEGPETISYATYSSVTGVCGGMTRGLAGTTDVAHSNGHSVQCGMSSEYLQQSPQYDTWNAAGTLTYASVDGPTQTATISGDSTTAIYPGVRLKYEQTQAIQNYWSFDTNSADSKGGATMADIGTPTYTAGKFSNALTLNGSNQALSITDAAAFKPTDNFSIGCWFKTSNTGATKMVFQSYSDNTNANGIRLYVFSSNVLAMSFGSNAADDTTNIIGSTTVTDGNWHYVVISYRNNFTQMYLDGKLEASGYTVTPTYAATNYVRIGCGNNTGSNTSWFNGQIDDLFIAAYALDEQTIAAKYAAATAQGTGDLTLTKYALVTASSYSAPNTTVTIYSGTDHTMMNSAISNAYYSTQKAPYGFPLDPDKWKVMFTKTGNYDNTPSPVAGTWYNYQSISVPIGRWSLGYSGMPQVTRAAGGVDVYATLSKTNNGETHNNFTTGTITTGIVTTDHVTRYLPVNSPAKTTWYLNVKCVTSNGDNLYLRSDIAPTIIMATSTLL